MGARLSLGLALALLSGPAIAQQPQPPLAVPNPTYVTIELEVAVNKPAAEVWKRVGKYCDLAEWLPVASGCKIIGGTDGQIGVIRSLGTEIMVGRSELSYTYAMPVREGRAYNLYHGTLEARPVNARTSRLVYTLFYDNSLVPGDAAAKQAEMDGRRAMFTRALNNMKILAEGGSLPAK